MRIYLVTLLEYKSVALVYSLINNVQEHTYVQAMGKLVKVSVYNKLKSKKQSLCIINNNNNFKIN